MFLSTSFSCGEGEGWSRSWWQMWYIIETSSELISGWIYFLLNCKKQKIHKVARRSSQPLPHPQTFPQRIGRSPHTCSPIIRRTQLAYLSSNLAYYPLKICSKDVLQAQNSVWKNIFVRWRLIFGECQVTI